jgi:hypothetical protein
MKKPEIYDRSSVEHNDQEKPCIRVNLAGQEIELPMQFVRTITEELLLAWVDAKRDEITNYGALALADLLDQLQPNLVLSPFSSKSIPMATQAVDHWNKSHGKKVPLITMYGGKDPEQIAFQAGRDGFFISYNPVTSTKQAKYIGLSHSQAQVISRELTQGNTIAILDDVYGTGATANAVREIIRLSTENDIPDFQLPVLVLAREIEGEYEGQEIEAVFASIILPIIRSSLE